MEHIHLIIVALFLSFVLFMLLFFVHKANLHNIPLNEGEIVLAEEYVERCHFESNGSTEHVFRPLIRITDKRILIGQKALIGNSDVIRMEITRNNTSENPDPWQGLRRGYISVVAEKISFEDHQGQQVIVITPVRNNGHGEPSSIAIETGPQSVLPELLAPQSTSATNDNAP